MRLREVCMDSIDVVYCWICGEHENVQRVMTSRGVHVPADRCYSNDLLYHSIRLFVKHSTHRGRIIIVSHSGVVPASIHRVCDRITVIDQDTILPAEYIPAFNNMIIECFLHRIPGISQPFLYMNDDYLMTGSFGMNDLVGDGRINVYRNTTRMDAFLFSNPGGVWDRTMVYNAKLANAHFHRPLSEMRMMQHMPYVLFPDTMERLCTTFHSDIHRMGVRHGPRSDEDVIMVFLHQEWWLSHHPLRVRVRSLTRHTVPSYAFIEYGYDTIHEIAQTIASNTVQFLTLSEGSASHHPVLQSMLESYVRQICE